MNEPAAIHCITHHAMATHFQVRIADQDPAYAEQAARAALAVADDLEALLSRFRETSEICQIARLHAGERLRLSEPVFACLEIARAIETATGQAFSVTAVKGCRQSVVPQWTLDRKTLTIQCKTAPVTMDLGAIGKGFALDRMADELAEWECPAHLLIAGGSSILAGYAPSGKPGWDSGLGDDGSRDRYWLARGSLSGSGVAVKGCHIINPRTGLPAVQRPRAWVVAQSAAESDALSTACMVLTEEEIGHLMTDSAQWRALLKNGQEWRSYGGVGPAGDKFVFEPVAAEVAGGTAGAVS